MLKLLLLVEALDYPSYRGLKKVTPDVTAIVSVADDGGGSGVLREDLGMLLRYTVMYIGPCQHGTHRGPHKI